MYMYMYVSDCHIIIIREHIPELEHNRKERDVGVECLVVSCGSTLALVQVAAYVMCTPLFTQPLLLSW